MGDWIRDGNKVDASQDFFFCVWGGGGGGGCEIVGRANRQGQPRGGGGSVGLVGST